MRNRAMPENSELREALVGLYLRLWLRVSRSVAIRFMAKIKYFQSKAGRPTMSQQHHRMTMLHPHFRLVSLRPNIVNWRGSVQPQPLSETYVVEVRHEQY